MSYIGNTFTTQAFTPAVDFFNGNGSTTAFTLSRPVASVAQVQAVISNVPQKPGDAFTVSGNTITFTSAPPSGTSNIYVYYTSPITQVIAPGQNTVGTTQIQDNAITTEKIAVGAVIPADLSTGAPTWDASGNLLVGGTSTTAKLAVANNTNDGTYNIKQYAVFGTTTTYLDSDASNLWGSGLGEFQIQNGTATRPAMLSLGGSVNTDEGMGVINFFRSGNTNAYRARVQIAGVVGSTGTAGQHGGYLQIRIAADGQTDPPVAVQFNPSGTVILKGGSTSATGTGITFPATQSASSDANTLDDYEEGTFSTSFSSQTNCSSVTLTEMSYTKTGRVVMLSAAGTFTVTSANVATAFAFSLPFNQAANTERSVGTATYGDYRVGVTVDNTGSNKTQGAVCWPTTSVVQTGAQNWTFTYTYMSE